ncbi:MAG: hypothetical protein AAGB22_07035, partial [Bacteroidota bacterium]
VASEIGANAYNALKKRLTDQLIEFSAGRLLSRELSAENHVIRLVVVARKLFSAHADHTAYMLLKKAEKLAIRLDHYALLNEIYHTLIEHSHKLEQVEQHVLFQKLERNNAQFLAEERLSVLYASMRKQFNTGNHGVLPTALRELYQQGLQAFGIQQEVALNFRSLNQLCTLTDLYGAQTKNYHQLDLFFEDKIAALQGTEKDTEKMLGYHIELLYGMANIHFRRKNAAKSLAYLDQMHHQLQRFEGKHAAAWKGRYANLRALNLNFSRQHEQAIQLIETVMDDPTIKEQDSALLCLTLSMIHLQQHHLEAVRILFRSLRKTEHWYLKQMGNEWLFNQKALEILLHVELGNDQLAESRIASFQRKFARHFRQDKDNPLWPFINLVKSVLFYPEKLHTPEFQETVNQSIPWKGAQEDLFNTCYYGWLKAKMLRQPTYETTLELVRFDQG